MEKLSIESALQPKHKHRKRLLLMGELERAALYELRSFLRTRSDARFVP